MHTKPHVTKPDQETQRRKSKEKQEHTKRSWQAYDQEETTRNAIEAAEQRQAAHVQLKKDLNTITVSTQDKNDIGMLSSGWKEFLPVLKDRLKQSQKLGYTRANEIARIWNEAGFMTRSGKPWTPRLVNIAKDEFGIKHGYKVVNK